MKHLCGIQWLLFWRGQGLSHVSQVSASSEEAGIRAAAVRRPWVPQAGVELCRLSKGLLQRTAQGWKASLSVSLINKENKIISCLSLLLLRDKVLLGWGEGMWSQFRTSQWTEMGLTDDIFALLFLRAEMYWLWRRKKNWIPTEKLLCRIWAYENKFWVNFNSPRKVNLNLPQPSSLKFW